MMKWRHEFCKSPNVDKALSNIAQGFVKETSKNFGKKSVLLSNSAITVRQKGFDLIDLSATSWKHAGDVSLGFGKGRVMWADTLYFRRPQIMRQILKSMDDRLALSKMLRALSVCQLYGFFDYAMELLDLAASDFIDKEEINKLKDHMKSQAPMVSRIPNFPGLRRTANLLTKMSKWFPLKKHSFKQPPLGNL